MQINFDVAASPTCGGKRLRYVYQHIFFFFFIVLEFLTGFLDFRTHFNLYLLTLIHSDNLRDVCISLVRKYIYDKSVL